MHPLPCLNPHCSSPSPYLTNCINVWPSTYRTNLKTLCTAQREVCLYTLCYCSAAQKFCLDKLINQQEGILAYKVINGTYLLNDFLNHWDIRHQIQLSNIGDFGWYHYMQQHILNSSFAIEPSIRGMAYQVTCEAHHSVLPRINYNSCI